MSHPVWLVKQNMTICLPDLIIYPHSFIICFAQSRCWSMTNDNTIYFSSYLFDIWLALLVLNPSTSTIKCVVLKNNCPSHKTPSPPREGSLIGGSSSWISPIPSGPSSRMGYLPVGTWVSSPPHSPYFDSSPCPPILLPHPSSDLPYPLLTLFVVVACSAKVKKATKRTKDVERRRRRK